MGCEQFPAECHAYRMLDPFRGVVHVLASEDGAAETLDGVHWTLYVRGEQVNVPSPGGDELVELGEKRYGLWSRTRGLRRLPVRDPTDAGRLERLGQRLTATLACHAGVLPFRLADRFELWLVDDQGRPLALVDSALSGQSLALPGEPAWHAGVIARDNFRSANRPECSEGPIPSIWLEQLVNRAAEVSRWYRREADGSAVEVAASGARLPAEAFPERLVREQWEDPVAEALLADFFDWQALHLLQLEQLSDPHRAELERMACRRPGQLTGRAALFPKVVDRDRITAALVMARLEAAAEPRDGSEPRVDLYPFFNE